MSSVKSWSLMAISLACCFSSVRHADAGEPTTTLVLSAAFANETFKTNEFIVLRESGQSLEWTATAHGREEDRNGMMRTSGSYLASAFGRIAKQPENRTPAKPTGQYVYSLLLIDSQGHVRKIAPLNDRQLSKAKTELRSVFDVILKQGSYAKSNIMLDVILSPDALRATTQPQ